MKAALITEDPKFYRFNDPCLSVVQLSPAAQQMHSSQQTHSLHAGQATGGRRRRSVDQDPDERRQKFLERNRAAATRCRQKRKVWVSALEKKAEELTHNNMQLQVGLYEACHHTSTANTITDFPWTKVKLKAD